MCLQYLPSAVEHLGTPSQVLPDRGGIWTRTRYLGFKMKVQHKKEEGPQTFVHSVVLWSSALLVHHLPCESRVLKK